MSIEQNSAQAHCVAIVDDDEAFRDSLSFLLDSHGFAVKSFASAQTFLESGDVRAQAFACLLLDIRMPGLTGPQLHQRLLDEGAAVPVIYVTAHGDVPMAVEAIKRGAFDFIEKPFSDSVVVERVRQAIAHRQVSHASTDQLLAKLATLTPREKQVMEAVVAGQLNKTIAYELGISIKTVEVHRARVMEKMQANSLAHLVKMTLG